MSSHTLYHNPRCSKSRQALALLGENGIEPEIVRYLETPLDAATLKALLGKLGLKNAHDLVRHNEADYKTAGLSPASDNNSIIDAMVKYPKLIERPILVHGKRAAIGRPPEKVLEIL